MQAHQQGARWVFVDEIQKAPRLLDYVHKLIESHSILFALTGSSARQLKRGAANLLAGRAYNYNLFPFVESELKEDFLLNDALAFGSLPKIKHLQSDLEKQTYLRGYVQNYLREEIRLEQIVRQLAPFRDFLEVSAQCSGKIINFSKIAKEIASTYKSVQNYFQILEDTLLGFYLPAYHKSVRKSQLSHPKFYYFDNGVKRQLEGLIDHPVREETGAYGELYEHWVVQNIYRHNLYSHKNYKLSYFATKNHSEIDLILSKGDEVILVEIKSAVSIQDDKVKSFSRAAQAFPASTKKYYISRDSRDVEWEGVHCLSLATFINNIFYKQ